MFVSKSNLKEGSLSYVLENQVPEPLVKSKPVMVYPEIVINPEKELVYAQYSKNNLQIVPVDKLRLKSDPSEAANLAEAKSTARAIEYMRNPSQAVMLADAGDGLGAYLLESTQLFLVNSNGNNIQYIKNPSEAVQLAAVKADPRSIQYIKNPSEAVQLVAVQYQPTYYIQGRVDPKEFPTYEVAGEGGAIRYIANPTEVVQLDAVHRNSRNIQYIKNPAEVAQMAAVTTPDYNIQYINNPTEAVQLAAIAYDRDSIQYIKNPSEAAKKAAQSMRW